MGSNPPPIPTADKAASSPRHILPSDLPAAIKYLNDQELDELQAAVTTELQRRGKKPPLSDKGPSERAEAATVSLTPTKLNAVRAAFKAGVRPSKIAKQFRIPQAEVEPGLNVCPGEAEHRHILKCLDYLTLFRRKTFAMRQVQQ